MSARPSVTLKLATSLDGRIATATGESKWITGEAARRKAHELRAAHASVLVGSGTVLADDPLLTVRLPDHDGPQPLRVVADTRRRVTADTLLAKSADESPVLIVVGRGDGAEAARRFAGTGVRVTEGETADGRLTATGVCDALAGQGIDSVFLEGGGALAASFLRAGLVDRIEWFRAPMVLGHEGRPAVGSLCVTVLDDAPRFARSGVKELGPDLWERYERTV
jgi:diaminohydroxyphosphoribosylaminopyrimidine deaminase/5-amino-6-(5-phosphoribosylamino)uracil reductase